MNRVLIIDGNYFAQRSLGTLNKKDAVNNLVTPDEQKAFTTAFNNALINLVEKFGNYVDNFVFCRDGYSWRKEIDPYKPYYVDDVRPVGYKEQRKSVKEESPIDYTNFYTLFKNCTNNLSDKMLTFDIEGLEGDDIIMLLSNKLKTDLPDIEFLIFCTDGDLMQTVKNNCMLFRNIKSKDAPFGEFVTNYKKYCDVFEQDAKQMMLGSTTDISYYKQLFSMSLFDNNTIERGLHRGINIATPFKMALIKSIGGDKKDNIFSIIAWKSTTGTREYKITENHIKKALREMDLELTEKNCQTILSDKELLLKLMITLKGITKQPDADIKEMAKHLKHNLRMIVLTPSNVPEKYIEKFEERFISVKDELYKKYDSSELRKLNITTSHSSTNVFANSLPDMNDLIKD